MAKLKVTLEKSVNSVTESQRATVRALGLKKIRSTAIHEDTPAIRGMIKKVEHLVKAEEV
ncbi:MAG: 50S ribosomal protein L30 [Clostridia bacterium]|nr:50S ribosomal protein L30 [Clostridia bacterium]